MAAEIRAFKDARVDAGWESDYGWFTSTSDAARKRHAAEQTARLIVERDFPFGEEALRLWFSERERCGYDTDYGSSVSTNEGRERRERAELEADRIIERVIELAKETKGGRGAPKGNKSEDLGNFLGGLGLNEAYRPIVDCGISSTADLEEAFRDAEMRSALKEVMKLFHYKKLEKHFSY